MRIAISSCILAIITMFIFEIELYIRSNAHDNLSLIVLDGPPVFSYFYPVVLFFVGSIGVLVNKAQSTLYMLIFPLALYLVSTIFGLIRYGGGNLFGYFYGIDHSLYLLGIAIAAGYVVALISVKITATHIN